MAEDIVKNISTISCVPKHSLDKLSDIAIYCIADTFSESGDTACMNIGIGEIHILKSNGELNYSFIPNSKLEKSLIKALSGENELEVKISDKLNSQFYKYLR